MVTETANAKLNLYLHILGKRADGYHLLESLVVFTDFGDSLRAEHGTGLSLVVDGEFADAAGNHDDNLVLRAARALQQACGITQGATLFLSKQIPVGAGLGGGSADAAAALRALCKLWAVIPSHEQLHAIAMSLGADVAMCLKNRPLMARGIGDEISPLSAPLPPLHLVLVYPRVHVATPSVYQRYRHEREIAAPAIDMADMVGSLAQSHNQLQRAAISVAPEVAEVLLALEGYPQAEMVRMCGSGSSCFALCASADAAAHLAEDITKRYPQWWVKATRAA